MSSADMLSAAFSMLSPGALELVRGLLTYDPTKRLLAEAALAMPYFTTEAPPMQLPSQYVLTSARTSALDSLPSTLPSSPGVNPSATPFSSLAEVGGEFHELEAKREKAKKRAKGKAEGRST